MDVRTFVGLSLDPMRLSLLGRSAEGRVDVAAVAQAFGVPERTVLVALGKLRTAGLISDDNSLDLDALRSLAATLPTEPAVDPAFLDGLWTDEEAAVLSRFFQGGRLTSVPSQHAKQLLVLERLAQEFAPGVRYREAEVNFTLQMFHSDFAMLRRYLVDEDMMTRADGVYWRTGGRYAPGKTPQADTES